MGYVAVEKQLVQNWVDYSFEMFAIQEVFALSG